MTKKNEQPEIKAYTPRLPFVPEESLMSEDEITLFIRWVLEKGGFDSFVTDGMSFFIYTIQEMANQDTWGLVDFCDRVRSEIYKHSEHCNLNQDKYFKGVSERYRKTKYVDEMDPNLYDEILGAEKDDEILDLSNQPENCNISAEGITAIINSGLSKDAQNVLRQWCANNSEVNND